MIPESHSDGRTNGQNSAGADSASGEIMLFGFRVKVDPLRKSVSMNDLSDYVHVQRGNNDGAATVTVDAGYASADNAVRHQSNGGRERKRGIPWTEDEHKLFLLGLKKVGKGDWRGISRNFVKTRTPTQVASHAQKYYLRRSNLSRRRRRSSLFDITTDSVAAIPMEEEQAPSDNHSQPAQPLLQPSHQKSPLTRFPMAAFRTAAYPVPSPLSTTNQSDTATAAFSSCNQLNWAPTPLVSPIPLLPTPAVSTPTRADNYANQKHERSSLSLSLSLNLASPCDHSNGFNNGDGLISVG